MSRNRWFCCCSLGCLLAVLAPFALVSVFFWLGSRRPANVPPQKTYTPAQVKAAHEHIETLKAQVEHVNKAADKGKREPFKYVVTEDDLNAYITQDPEAGRKLTEKGFKDVRVTLGDGEVGVQASIPAMGRYLWVLAEGPVRAGERGHVLFQPTRVEFGRIKWFMPEKMRDQMLQKIKEQSNGGVFRVPGEIKELRITPGKLVVTGVTDPEIAAEMKEAEKRPQGMPGSPSKGSGTE